MAAEEIFANLSVARVDAHAISKKLTCTDTRRGSAWEIYDASGRLVAVHEKFPVDLGHKQL